MPNRLFLIEKNAFTISQKRLQVQEDLHTTTMKSVPNFNQSLRNEPENIRRRLNVLALWQIQAEKAWLNLFASSSTKISFGTKLTNYVSGFIATKSASANQPSSKKFSTAAFTKFQIQFNFGLETRSSRSSQLVLTRKSQFIVEQVKQFAKVGSVLEKLAEEDSVLELKKKGNRLGNLI